QRVARLDTVELRLYLAATAAAEVQLTAARDDARLGRDRLRQIVDGQLAQLVGADGLLRGRRLRVDLLLAADLDLLERLRDLLRAERERDGRDLPGRDGDRLNERVVADRLPLHLMRSRRDAGDHERTVVVGHRALFRVDDDDVGERGRLLARIDHL